jgi:hypothetical protein
MGPGEWLKTSVRLKTTNLMPAQAFSSVSQFLVKLEESGERRLASHADIGTFLSSQAFPILSS